MYTGLCRVQCPVKTPFNLRAEEQGKELSPESLKAHRHGPRKMATQQELIDRKGNGAPAGRGQGCRGGKKYFNLPLILFLHLLPVVRPNLKPEGNGTSITQPKKSLGSWENDLER